MKILINNEVEDTLTIKIQINKIKVSYNKKCFLFKTLLKVVAIDTSVNEYISFIKKGIHEYTLEYTEDNKYNSRGNKVVIKCICKEMYYYYINGLVNV